MFLIGQILRKGLWGMRDTDYMQLFDSRMERGSQPLSHQIAVLQGLGLTVPENIVQEVFQKGNPPSDFGELLAAIGVGEFDWDTGVWTPVSNQVFSFDGEVFSIENMYPNFIKGLQAISEGELVFSDAAQDDSDVDWEAPGGIMHVSYRINGVLCSFDAQFMGDWLDVSFQDAVNHELEKLGVQKRFYATDGIQGNTLFFCTEEWARKFEEATLCYMSYSGNI